MTLLRSLIASNVPAGLQLQEACCAQQRPNHKAECDDLCLCRTTRGQHRSADGRSDEHELDKSSKVGVGGRRCERCVDDDEGDGVCR